MTLYSTLCSITSAFHHFHHSMSFSENAFNKTNKAKGNQKGCRQILRGLNTSEWHKGVQSVNATPKAPHSNTVYGYPLLFLQRPSHWHTQTHTHSGRVSGQSQWNTSCPVYDDTAVFSEMAWPSRLAPHSLLTREHKDDQTVSETSRLN